MKTFLSDFFVSWRQQLNKRDKMSENLKVSEQIVLVVHADIEQTYPALLKMLFLCIMA